MLLPMAPTDSLFLIGESRDHPMHVGGVALFTPAADTIAADMRRLFDEALTKDPANIKPAFRKRARRSLTSLGQWGWDVLADQEIDLSHHIRVDALPAPGGMTELTALVSRLHSTLLDRSRPLWEMHLIEGLADGRCAVYTKIHHALTDGVSAMRLLRMSMTENPCIRHMPALWQIPHSYPVPSPPASEKSKCGKFFGTGSILSMTREFVHTAAVEAAGLVPATISTLDRAMRGAGGAVALTAPHTLFNVQISGSRHVAARSFSLERVQSLAKHVDATVNDIVLTLCAGALRAYLRQLDALPTAPMIAMVPVSLHANGNSAEIDGLGNRVGQLMCNLATNLPDPEHRLAAVRASMREGKDALRAMSPSQVLAMSALGLVPLGAEILLGWRGPQRPPFNIIISNIAGASTQLYWNGFRLDSIHPLSIPTTGQALNITCTSTDDHLVIGFTSCRRTVPDLNRLVDHLDQEFDLLEANFGMHISLSSK